MGVSRFHGCFNDFICIEISFNPCCQHICHAATNPTCDLSQGKLVRPSGKMALCFKMLNGLALSSRGSQKLLIMSCVMSDV